MATGRTNKRWIYFIIGDSGNVLRNIPVDSINGVGLQYPEAEVTAFQDAIVNVLPSIPDLVIEFGGPFDNTAAAATPTLSGSHTILNPINGDGIPRTLDIQFGIGHAWQSGEPEFGISRSATSGLLLVSYIVDPDKMSYKGKLRMFGSVAPAWGTTARV